MVVGVVVLFASLILWGIRRRRAAPRKRHVPPMVRLSCLLSRAGLAHLGRRCGLNQGFGFLQYRVLVAARGLRTMSVRGTVRLPGAMDVDIADDDWPVVAMAPEAFLRDVAIVLRTDATERGWEIEGELDLRFNSLGNVEAGSPVVAVALDRDMASSLTPLAVNEDGSSSALRAEGLPRTLDQADLPPTAHSTGLVLLPQEAIMPALHLGSADRDIVVGRTGNVDLTVPDPTVSSRHCRLFRGQDGIWKIVDLRSKNGTRVNAVVAQRAVPLANGDLVVLGAVRYEVAGL